MGSEMCIRDRYWMGSGILASGVGISLTRNPKAMSKKCIARVPDFTGFHSYPCGNKAKALDLCGTHLNQKLRLDVIRACTVDELFDQALIKERIAAKKKELLG